jgi:hypothetical protein
VFHVEVKPQSLQEAILSGLYEVAGLPVFADGDYFLPVDAADIEFFGQLVVGDTFGDQESIAEDGNWLLGQGRDGGQ